MLAFQFFYNSYRRIHLRTWLTFCFRRRARRKAQWESKKRTQDVDVGAVDELSRVRIDRNQEADGESNARLHRSVRRHAAHDASRRLRRDVGARAGRSAGSHLPAINLVLLTHHLALQWRSPRRPHANAIARYSAPEQPQTRRDREIPYRARASCRRPRARPRRLQQLPIRPQRRRRVRA